MQEFKHLVKTLHEAGIEVILDVVYNHTAEGNHLGPMLSFKGIDNPAYYRLMPDNRRHYMDYTGTGNTLNMRHPHVLQLIMDSLRYWVIDMHVDGFRFDLAATLARELHDVDRLSAFFDIIQQDPVISQVKLIAEPWDVGEGGYQVGNFPPLWSEWNGKYRDSVRDFWRGTDQTLAEFAYRFTGSSDLYEGHRAQAVRERQLHHRARRLHAARSRSRTTRSTTRRTAKTTATARATTDRGTAAPRVRPTIPQVDRAPQPPGAKLPDDADAVAGRADAARRGRDRPHPAGQQQRLLPGQRDLLVRLGSGRRGSAAVHPRTDPAAPSPSGVLPAPLVPGAADSRDQRQRHRLVHARTASRCRSRTGRPGFAKSLGVFLNGRGIPTPNERGEKVVDDSFYAMFNASHEPVEFTLPEAKWGQRWVELLETDDGSEELRGRSRRRGAHAPVAR